MLLLIGGYFFFAIIVTILNYIMDWSFNVKANCQHEKIESAYVYDAQGKKMFLIKRCSKCKVRQFYAEDANDIKSQSEYMI